MSNSSRSNNRSRQYATPAEIKAMQKAAAEVEARRKKYPTCKHPRHRVRPLVPGHSFLWCSLCWEAWEPDPFAIPGGMVTIRPGTTATVTTDS